MSDNNSTKPSSVLRPAAKTDGNLNFNWTTAVSHKRDRPFTMDELTTLSMKMFDSISQENGDELESDGIFVIKVPAENSEDGQFK
ncbi:hypothetical protein V865_008526 [Kwoniella europaea PYCC6329]|uniref:Uncharacterized protein n=1 Tax=Kwoniella europaea PYCC6329 TaxID=1423913 RepID=A0AAX4KVA8_9TREE